MKAELNSRNVFVFTAIIVIGFIASSVVYSHCQIPCGIYDDDMRFKMMAEHITTIEKSIKMVNQISGEEKPNMNQLIRWVKNKETHADELSHIITHYFMAQRIKSIEKTNAVEYEKYLEKLTLLHQMLVFSMKAKQTADLSITNQLTELLTNFKNEVYHGQVPKTRSKQYENR